MKSMNARGYTFIEVILSIVIATLVFVFLTKILYNYTKPNDPLPTLNFEAFIAKVENDLWYVNPDDLLVSEEQLIYTLNRTRYVYYAEDGRLFMAIGPEGKETAYIWMEGIDHITFIPKSFGIQVIVNHLGEIYEETIFYSRF